MEHTALRPKPMPGQEAGQERGHKPGHGSGGGTGPGGTPRRPHAARRRGRRARTLLFAVFVGTVLVLSGVGLGTVGATVIGLSELAELRQRAGGGAPGAQAGPSASARPSPSASPRTASVPGGAVLGVEVVDGRKGGALVVGVHVPGPGHRAGLVRGDLLLWFGRTRIDSATDLARAVAKARPGAQVLLTLRHRSGGYQQVTVRPGVVT
jgi:membrane-associated protease RseP (regulator of RpoE activity)